MKKVVGLWSAVGLLSTTFATAAWGGGLGLYEMGTPDTGTAMAGRAALATDASTAFVNPAGMTHLDSSQILIGLQPTIFDVKFSQGAGTQLFPPGVPTGSSGGNAVGLFPIVALFAAFKVTPDLSLGASLASYFGLGLQYDDSWVGRYYTQQAALYSFTLNPTFAYRVADWLSVGGGPMVLWSQMHQRAAVNNALPQNDPQYPDGRLDFKNEDVSVGGNIGIFSEPIKGARFGLQYFTPVNLTFSDNFIASGLGPRLTASLRATGLLNRGLSIDMTVPQMLMLSGYYQLTKTVALMGNFGWQQWSQFGLPDISLASGDAQTFAAKLNYSDTFHGALGVHYQLSKPWLLTAGYAYDSSPLDATSRTPSAPLDHQMRFALGADYTLNETVTLGVQFEYVAMGNANIDQNRVFQGNLHGDYSSNFGLAGGLQGIIRF